MHLEHHDDERIQRLLHDELDTRSREAALRHLRECSQCARRLDEARREEEWIHEELRHADDPAPQVNAETLIRNARRDGTAWGRRAAGVLIALAAGGAAYAIPGSPVRGWVDRAAGFFSPLEATTQLEEGKMSRPPASSGIAVAPGERFTIRFETSQSEGVAVVSLTEGSDVVARAMDAAVTFTTDVARLIIENSASTASYEIELPRSAPWIEIQIGHRRLLLKDGPQVIASVTPDARGRYVLSLAP